MSGLSPIFTAHPRRTPSGIYLHEIVNRADSTGQRNKLGEFLNWHHIVERLSRPSVKAPLNSHQVVD